MKKMTFLLVSFAIAMLILGIACYAFDYNYEYTDYWVDEEVILGWGIGIYSVIAIVVIFAICKIRYQKIFSLSLKDMNITGSVRRHKLAFIFVLAIAMFFGYNLYDTLTAPTAAEIARKNMYVSAVTAKNNREIRNLKANILIDIIQGGAKGEIAQRAYDFYKIVVDSNNSDLQRDIAYKGLIICYPEFLEYSVEELVLAERG